MLEKKYKVCVVTVTYGDRFKYLKEVIKSCFEEGIDKIIIVDNASAESSRKQLRDLQKKYKDKIKVIYLDENLGSAGGYKKGLEEAYKCKECEFIWLLDDDNVPQKGALKQLIEFWKKLKYKEKEEKIALLSFRPDREIYKMSVLENKTQLLLGRQNSFLGFHFIDLPGKFWRNIKKRLKKTVSARNTNIKAGIVPVATYGGLFFHKNLLKIIGFPREEFFLYVDDHEWTYRITKFGGKIFVVFDSIVEDIETSWYLKEKKNSSFSPFLSTEAQMRIYYSVRNRVIFERENLVTVPLIYYLNIFLYKFLLEISKIFSKDRKIASINLRVFNKAVKDGLKGVTGKNKNFNI